MAKYAKHNEHTYRSAFRKGIDWCVYNTKLIRELFDTENDLLAVAIDQSYIRKAWEKDLWHRQLLVRMCTGRQARL